MSEREVCRLDCSSCEGTRVVFEAIEPTGERHTILCPHERFEAHLDELGDRVEALKSGKRGGLAHWFEASDAIHSLRQMFVHCMARSISCPTCSGTGYAVRLVRTDA